MHHSSLPTGFVAIAFGLITCTTAAQAANETWVSGTGSDAGICPRTAPCRTFQFAHDQTSNRGAINVLTSGNFGPLTINRPISIVAQGVEAVINTGVSGAGITVQAGGSAIVSLRGLTIDMRGTANHGISFVSGGALHIHDCVIRRTEDGIRFAPIAGTPELYVTDTIVADAGQSANIYVQPIEFAGARVVLDRVRVENGSNAGIVFTGSFTSGTTTATVRDSVSSGSPIGIWAHEPEGTVNVMVDRTALVNNNTGVLSQGADAVIRIGDSTVTGNGTGLQPSGGLIFSYGTNKINGNGTDGDPSFTIDMK